MAELVNHPTYNEFDVLVTIYQYELGHIDNGAPIQRSGVFYISGSTNPEHDDQIRSLLYKGYLAFTNYTLTANPPIYPLRLTDKAKQFLKEGTKC